MRNLTAAIYFVLSLFGCDGGGRTIVTQSSVDGADALYSRTQVRTDIARFECIRSASGHCHYTVFPRECVAAEPGTKQEAKQKQPEQDKATACAKAERFALPVGASREVVGMAPQFDLCVRSDAVATGADCAAQGTQAVLRR